MIMMHRRHLLFSTGWFIALLCSGTEIVAQSKSDAPLSLDEQQASEHFRRGEALFANGDYTEAAQEFIQAYSIAPHPSVCGNIALSFDTAGNYPQAVRWYRQLIKETPNYKGSRKLEVRLRELEALVGELRVTCALADCEVRIDYMDEGTAPLSAVVSPGPHYVEALVQGKVVAAIRVSAVTGKVVNVELGVTPSKTEASVADRSGQTQRNQKSPKQEPEQEVSLPAKKPPHRTAGGVLLGIGGAALVAGVVLESVGYSRYRDLAEECSGFFGNEVCPPGYRTERRNKIQSNFLAGDILLGAGIAVAAGGVLLYLLAPRSKPKKRVDAGPDFSWFASPSRGGGFVGWKVLL